MNEQVFLSGAPVVGFGQAPVVAPVVAVAAPASPWTVALVTSMLSAATGWVIEEVAQNVRGKRRER